MKTISLKSVLDFSVAVVAISFFSYKAVAQNGANHRAKRQYFVVINEARLTFPLVPYHPNKFAYRLQIQETPAPPKTFFPVLDTQSETGVISPLRVNRSRESVFRYGAHPKQTQPDFSGVLLVGYSLFSKSKTSFPHN